MIVIASHTIKFEGEYRSPGAELDFPDGHELSALLASGALIDPEHADAAGWVRPNLAGPAVRNDIVSEKSR